MAHVIALLLFFVLPVLVEAQAASSPIDYPIVYVRAPRDDAKPKKWQDVAFPFNGEPGTDLMLLHPNGTEEVLYYGKDGTVLDPAISFDAQWVYFSWMPFTVSWGLNPQIHHQGFPMYGADIYKIKVQPDGNGIRQLIRLTNGGWSPNTSINWSKDPLKADPAGSFFSGYYPLNTAPCPLPGGKLMFTSTKNTFQPTKNASFPTFQLFVLDEATGIVEQIGHLNIGSALHPVVLKDGRVMFSSYESQGLRDGRLWGLWGIWPDGRNWEPLVSAFAHDVAWHFQTQLSNGSLAVVGYYFQNNQGFGALMGLSDFPINMPLAPSFVRFGPENPALNPTVRIGYHPDGITPKGWQMPFTPHGWRNLSGFATLVDEAASINGAKPNERVGKVTHPSGAPNNDVLLVWSGPYPANLLKRPTNYPYVNGGIYLLKGGVPVDRPEQLVKVKDEYYYSEQQPKALVPYKAIYGVDEPAILPWRPNDGTVHAALPPGTPFGLVGVSTNYKSNVKPGESTPSRWFESAPTTTTQNDVNSDWLWQGASVGKWENKDIHAIRVLMQEPTSYFGVGKSKAWFNWSNERLRILGDVPLRKFDATGKPILDVDGNPDTSFLAVVPADVSLMFQLLDADGMTLTSSQTWHQVRPGEKRENCGGCHAHAQVGTDFAQTAAAKPDYVVPDLTKTAPIDVEWNRDIAPIFKQRCVSCHATANPAGGLILDDANTWSRLAYDEQGALSPRKPPSGGWKFWQSSYYVRKHQARRSLLSWVVLGKRTDGWANADSPSDAQAPVNESDIDYTDAVHNAHADVVASLTAEEKLAIVQWIDLGSPQSWDASYGWFHDETRPTVAVTADTKVNPPQLLLGMYDGNGLDMASLSVQSTVSLTGEPVGENLASKFAQHATNPGVWTMALPCENKEGVVTVQVKDMKKNLTVRRSKLSIACDVPPPTYAEVKQTLPDGTTVYCQLEGLSAVSTAQQIQACIAVDGKKVKK